VHEYISTAEVELAVVPPSQTSLPRAPQCATSTEHTPERRTRPAAARGLDPELTGGVDHSIVVGDDLGEVAAELLCGWRRGSRRATAGPACCARTRPRTSSPSMTRHGGSAGRAIASSTLTDITDTLVTRPASAPRNAAMGFAQREPEQHDDGRPQGMLDEARPVLSPYGRECSRTGCTRQGSCLVLPELWQPDPGGRSIRWPRTCHRRLPANASSTTPRVLPSATYKRLLGDRHPRHAALRSTGRRARTSAPKDALRCRSDATERHVGAEGALVASGKMAGGASSRWAPGNGPWSRGSAPSAVSCRPMRAT